jgi:hypothetical protein
MERTPSTATQTDPTGHTSPASPTRAFTVDTTLPAPPVITAPAHLSRHHRHHACHHRHR